MGGMNRPKEKRGYAMGYISSEQVKTIRESIKKEFPKFKFSVTRQDFSTVCIAIMESPIDFGKTYAQVNHYHYASQWGHNQDAKTLFEKIMKIVEETAAVEYYETGDYGNQPNYYTHLAIGKWDKPYQVK